MTVLSSLFEQVEEKLDAIINAYSRPANLTKTKIYYQNEVVELDIVNMTESDLDRTKCLEKIEFGTNLETIEISFGRQDYLSEITFHGKTVAQVKAMSGYDNEWGIRLAFPTVYCEDGSFILGGKPKSSLKK